MTRNYTLQAQNYFKNNTDENTYKLTQITNVVNSQHLAQRHITVH